MLGNGPRGSRRDRVEKETMLPWDKRCTAGFGDEDSSFLRCCQQLNVSPWSPRCPHLPSACRSAWGRPRLSFPAQCLITLNALTIVWATKFCSNCRICCNFCINKPVIPLPASALVCIADAHQLGHTSRPTVSSHGPHRINHLHCKNCQSD